MTCFATNTIAYQGPSSEGSSSKPSKNGMGDSAVKKISQKIGPLLDQRP